ncbi:MAG TPA: FUSC family protein, partial [Salinimicrobium sp.]|nr:FUSC family protein [Salinimicrobium sp.]
RNIQIKAKEAEKFITHQEYSLKKLQSNIDFKSRDFRHSLRLTLVILLGLCIGKIFEVQNAYWILLTSLVIMRPGYALTKTRFKQRLFGTLIGGSIATLIILITQNLVIHGILAIVTFILAFSMIQRNYKTAAAFITLNVVFVYSLLTPNAFEVIQFRLLDTLIGAGLAFLGNSFLWPTWEVKTINNFIASSIGANKDYLREIELFYRKKGDLPTAYKLSRKNAFLESGNLSAAFQRITQEPKLNVNVGTIYKIVTLNQEILSSIASLGTFIRTQETTAASAHFISYMDLIQVRLNNSVLVLEGKAGTETIDDKKMKTARNYFKAKTKELINLKNNERIGIGEGNSEIGRQLQEAQLIFEQLQWLLEVSSDMEEMIIDYKNHHEKLE